MAPDECNQLAALARLLAESIAVVVVEHDMAFVRSLDAEVTVLHQGAVFAQGDIEELRKGVSFSNPIILYDPGRPIASGWLPS